MTLGELWTVDFELATDADHYAKSLVTIRMDFRRTQIIIPNHWYLSAFNQDWGDEEDEGNEGHEGRELGKLDKVI